MRTPIRDATWPQIEALRDALVRDLPAERTLTAAAQTFAKHMTTSFATVALARVFYVTTLRRLPPPEHRWASDLATSLGRTTPLDPETPVLSLLGTSGAMPAWNDRTASLGHRAIPLIDKRFVDGAPMIGALLAALDVELSTLRPDGTVQLRRLSGGINARFYVPDARTSTDAQGRKIIASADFVAANDIRTVFGMGGAYLDGTLVAAILFTREELTAPEIDRFPSLIGSFKISTGALVEQGAIFPAP